MNTAEQHDTEVRCLQIVIAALAEAALAELTDVPPFNEHDRERAIWAVINKYEKGWGPLSTERDSA